METQDIALIGGFGFLILLFFCCFVLILCVVLVGVYYYYSTTTTTVAAAASKTDDTENTSKDKDKDDKDENKDEDKDKDKDEDKPPVENATYNILKNTDYVSQGDITSQNGNATSCKTLCDNMPKCKGFVTNGEGCWFKDDTVRDPTYHALFDYYYKGAAPSAEAVAPTIVQNDYIFYQGVDSTGGDIDKVNGTVEQMKAACDARPDCKGFNTNGYMKGTVVEKDKMTKETWMNSSEGFYVKKT